MRYVSGYTSDDATLFVTLEHQYFLTDPRYTEQAAAECPDWELVNWREIGTMADAVAACRTKRRLPKPSVLKEASSASTLIRRCANA